MQRITETLKKEGVGPDPQTGVWSFVENMGIFLRQSGRAGKEKEGREKSYHLSHVMLGF